MLTNVFRIGGFQQVTWFQLVADVERIASGGVASDVASNGAWMEKGLRDMSAVAIIMAHMRLQEKGYLSNWTFCPRIEDHRIKLWIFTPGIHETLSTSVLPNIVGLKVVRVGSWCSPGANEEVGGAFCEALRNRMERSLRDASYIRFGEVFVKCRRYGALESRKVLPTCELVFTGSEEALYVHVVIRRKRVKILAPSDLQFVLSQHSKSTAQNQNSLSVVVAPHGSTGRLTGCCPGDLATQLYRSKLQAFNSSALPFRPISASVSGAVAGAPCHAEVRVGQAQLDFEPRGAVASSAGIAAGSHGALEVAPDQARGAEEEWQTNFLDGRVLIYPMEAVLAPVISPAPARTYLRRCWLQEWAGTRWLEESSVIPDVSWNEVTDCSGNRKLRVGVGPNGSVVQRSGGSSSASSSSGGSNIRSSSRQSGSSSSTGSSHSSGGEVGTGDAEFEADAESLAKAASIPIGASSVHPLGTNIQNLSQAVEGPTSGLQGSKRNRGKGVAYTEESPSKLVKMSGSPSSDLTFLDEIGTSDSKRAGGNGSSIGMQGSVGVGASTPKGTPSQAGTPWDWPDEGMGLGFGGMGMDMQTDADILAEFGDFGDFFEDEGLGFGEPPGTAESQAWMVSDFGDGVTTPGGLGLDGADQMMLPMLDFPALENFGKQLNSSTKELIQQDVKNHGGEAAAVYNSGQVSPHVTTPAPYVDPLSKVEALIMFAPGYARVELPSVKDDPAFSSTYVPESRNRSHLQTWKATYSYSAIPPPPILVEVGDSKLEAPADQALGDIVESQVTAEAVDQKGQSKQASNIYGASGDSVDGDSIATSKLLRGTSHVTLHGFGSNGPSSLEHQFSPSGHDSFGKPSFSSLDPRIVPTNKSASPVLATELDCALVHISMLCAKDKCLANNTNKLTAGTPPGYIKSPALGFGKEEPPQSQGRAAQQRRQNSMPSRIAGDVDEDMQEGLRSAQVGVWRPVQSVLSQVAASSTADSRVGSTSGSPDTGNLGLTTLGSAKPANLQSIVDAIPLLVQQAAVAFDIALDGECGDGALGWLTLQERERMQGACGPGMSHTACGGMLSTRHCLDDAGVEYIDPLAAEVSPAMVAHLLQSDFRAAFSAAFGEGNIDGPLTAPDWCRYRSQNDSSSLSADSKEGVGTITSAGGDPLAGPGSIGTSKNIMGMEDIDQRRGGMLRSLDSSSLSDQGRADDVIAMDMDPQPGSAISGAIVALPVPAVLVGYQDDWLKASPNILHLWEKAPIEPYAHPKPVNYYVLCMGLESLMCAASDFFQQLSSVYEACRLGTHVPGTVTPTPTAPTGLLPGSSKHLPPGFILVDAAGPHPAQSVDSTLSLMASLTASMDKGWNLEEFRKALWRVCKTIPAAANLNSVQRDPEQSQCTVVYVISPSSEPADVLQIVVDASQCLGLMMSEKDRKSPNYSHTVGVSGDDPAICPVLGFSTSRLVLHVLPADTILKMSGTVASQLDTLKEYAFSVYSKARRIQRKVLVPESGLLVQSISRGRSGLVQNSAAMPGMWKDCNTGRSTAVGGLMDSGPLRTSWDGSRQVTSRFGESPMSDGTPHGSDLHTGSEAYRYLYEPLFILADPGFPDPNANTLSKSAAGKEALRSSTDDATAGIAGMVQSLSEPSSNSGADWSDVDNVGAGHAQVADLHCCYVWTDDWQWLLSTWTDGRGELLDVQCFPSGASQREAGLQVLFCQVLQQGLQLLSMSVDAGSQQSRNIIITRVGDFTEKECQEWHRAVIAVGGDESRKWSQQLWPGLPNSSPSPAQMQDVLFSERTLGLASSGSRPPSPSPASSFTSRSRSSGAPMNFPRRQGQGLGQNQFAMESKGPFYWVKSISLVSVCVDHSLQAVSVQDTNPSGMTQGGSSMSSWPGSPVNSAVGSITSGLTTVKTLAKAGASYLLVPARSMRILNPQTWHATTPSSPSNSSTLSPVQSSQGSSIAPPLASAYVISPPTPFPRSEFVEQNIKDEWPSTIRVGLVALLGDFSSPDFTSSVSSSKAPKDFSREIVTDPHRVVQLVAAQVHALSWLTVSPTTRLRHSPLPFHCNIAQRIRRLLSYLPTAVARFSQTP